jgi:hypothetical protein
VVSRRAGLDTDQTWRQLLEESQYIATLQLPANNHLAASVNAVTWKTDLAISKPIVVIVCMACSSESREPQQRPHPWHRCAGGGAVHSISSGSSLLTNIDHLVGEREKRRSAGCCRQIDEPF